VPQLFELFSEMAIIPNKPNMVFDDAQAFARSISRRVKHSQHGGGRWR
jgi:hypothetical protein